MKDSNQKDLISRHFGKRGWYTQLEMPVYYGRGIELKPKEITDIDVLGLRPGNDLRWELVFADCKTLKGQSPVNRALWMKGLMDYFGANCGLIILGGSKVIEKDHKLFASKLNITILHESEFDSYDRSMLYPDGSNKYSIKSNDLLQVKILGSRFPKLKPLINYMFQIAWNEDNKIEFIRKIIGELKSISKEIDPDNNEHVGLFFEACSFFSIGLAECIGIIFNQYLKPETKEELEEALKIVIWGGRSQYDFISKLRQNLMVAKGVKPEELTLPSWEKFLELIRNILECPYLAFNMPYLFQRGRIDLQKGNAFLDHTSNEELLLLKFMMLTSQYLCSAAQLPKDFCKGTRSLFENRQSAIIHGEIK